jgi:NAD(P)H-dependent flavin oxidoreductase YrpB (nitropropane dioxygenase family)
MEWNNRLTKLLGCKYPIMEGSLTGCGTWEFAAAVSKTGADGCITAGVYKTPDGLRDAIKKIRTLTDHFTVNISIGGCPNIDGMFEVCFEEQVPCLETSVYRPDEYADRIKKSGIKWIHKGATVRFIKHAENLGADAVVLVGLDGWGFKNIRQLPTFTSIAWARDQIKVPLIAAGGIGNGRTMAAALAAGADGVYIGSAIMATNECPISSRIKENMVKAVPDEPELIRELVAPPAPENYKKIMEARKTLSFEKWIRAMEAAMLKHEWTGQRAMWEETVDELGAPSREGGPPRGPFSFCIAYIHQIVSVQEFIENMAKEAEEILEGMAKQYKLGKINH